MLFASSIILGCSIADGLAETQVLSSYVLRLLEYAGALAHDDYLEIVEILKDTEQVDAIAW